MQLQTWFRQNQIGNRLFFKEGKSIQDVILANKGGENYLNLLSR